MHNRDERQSALRLIVALAVLVVSGWLIIVSGALGYFLDAG
ncbi:MULTISPECIES: hypothetical protein [unclassified Cryobacterium]|nr:MULTISPECIES: hypothetical protein [unclassified Cryobacterium]